MQSQLNSSLKKLLEGTQGDLTNLICFNADLIRGD